MTFKEKVAGALLVALFVGASATIDLNAAFSMAPAGAALRDSWLGIPLPNAEATKAGVLLAVAFGAAIWKSFGLIRITGLARAGRYGLATAGTILLMLTVAVSVFFELTFYSDQMSSSTSWRTQVASSRDRIKAEIGALDTKIADRAHLRTAEEVEAQIETLLNRTVNDSGRQRAVRDLTSGCTNTKSWAFTHCSDFSALNYEMTAAKAVAAMRAERAALERQLGTGAVITTGHAGAAYIARWLGVDQAKVLDGVVLLLLVMLQLACVTVPYAYFGARLVEHAAAPPAVPVVPLERAETAALVPTANDNDASQEVARPHTALAPVVAGITAKDRIEAFVRQHVTFDPNAEAVRKTKVFAAYQQLTGSDVSAQIFHKIFGDILSASGVNPSTRLGDGQRAYAGIRLSHEAEAAWAMLAAQPIGRVAARGVPQRLAA